MARRTHRLVAVRAAALRKRGVEVGGDFFDTLHVTGVDAAAIHARAAEAGINLRRIDDTSVGISLDETTTRDDVVALAQLFDRSEEHTSELQSLMRTAYAVVCLQKNIKTNNK